MVGRGPTNFDYRELADIADPIFFINDAVCLEKYARSETFFFAHDVEMRVWLDGSIKAAASCSPSKARSLVTPPA